MSKINTNIAIVCGNLARDCELRYTANQKPVMKFTVACERQGPDKEQIADFFPVVVWGKAAETLERYLTKGQGVIVSGRLQTRSYEAKDGHKVWVTEIVITPYTGTIELIGGRRDSNGQGGGGYSSAGPARQSRQQNNWYPDDAQPMDISELEPATASQPQNDADDIPF